MSLFLSKWISIKDTSPEIERLPCSTCGERVVWSSLGSLDVSMSRITLSKIRTQASRGFPVEKPIAILNLIEVSISGYFIVHVQHFGNCHIP